MRKIMKSSTDKNVIVKLNNLTFTVKVNGEIFDTAESMFIEAVTKVVEKHKKDMSFFHKMKCADCCYEKKDAKTLEAHFEVNMYHALINAGFYSVAELLREKTINLHEIDIKLEPACANAGKSSTDKQQ